MNSVGGQIKAMPYWPAQISLKTLVNFIQPLVGQLKGRGIMKEAKTVESEGTHEEAQVAHGPFLLSLKSIYIWIT